MNRPDLRGQCGGLLMRIEGQCALKTMHCHMGEGCVTCFSQLFSVDNLLYASACMSAEGIVIRGEAPQYSKILLGSI